MIRLLTKYNFKYLYSYNNYSLEENFFFIEFYRSFEYISKNFDPTHHVGNIHIHRICKIVYIIRYVSVYVYIYVLWRMAKVKVKVKV